MAEGLQRAFLQKNAESKIRDAEVLFANQRFSGAYYLAGYAVELGLKACIARRMLPETIPDKTLVLTTYQHNYKALVGAAGLTPELEHEQANNLTFGEYWGIAGGWSPNVRYEIVEQFSAQIFIQAINDPEAGIEMDTAALVKDGQALVSALDAAGFPPLFAMWVYNSDADVWRLWIVPPSNLSDEREFYRKVATIISQSQGQFSVLDAGDVDLRRIDHPAVKGVRGFIKMPGLGDTRLSNNTFNGFFIPNGIALRVNI